MDPQIYVQWSNDVFETTSATALVGPLRCVDIKRTQQQTGRRKQRTKVRGAVNQAWAKTILACSVSG